MSWQAPKKLSIVLLSLAIKSAGVAMHATGTRAKCAVITAVGGPAAYGETRIGPTSTREIGLDDSQILFM
jgi:hypothetical protein